MIALRERLITARLERTCRYPPRDGSAPIGDVIHLAFSGIPHVY
jgi:hypothetical protein